MKAYMFAICWRIACIDKNSSILLIRAPQHEQWLKLNLVLKLICLLLNIGVITYLRLSSKIVNKRCACQQIVGRKCRWARFIVEHGHLNDLQRNLLLLSLRHSRDVRGCHDMRWFSTKKQDYSRILYVEQMLKHCVPFKWFVKMRVSKCFSYVDVQPYKQINKWRLQCFSISINSITWHNVNTLRL